MKLFFWLVPACLLVAAFAVSAATPAQAPQSADKAASSMPVPPVPKFEQADPDGNGKITWNEAKKLGVPKEIFEQDDFDKSGDLNATEWMFVRLDMTDFTPDSTGED